MALDIVALVNVDAAALSDTAVEMLKDFVNHGGTLVYGGDLWAYSRGSAGTGTMAELLPVRFAAKDAAVTALRGQPVLAVKGGKVSAPLAPGAVMEYVTESFTVKDGAEVLLSCRGLPVVVAWTVGQGRVDRDHRHRAGRARIRRAIIHADARMGCMHGSPAAGDGGNSGEAQ